MKASGDRMNLKPVEGVLRTVMSGYPKSQFSVAVMGREKMRLRVPMVVRGHYLGDLTAVYAMR